MDNTHLLINLTELRFVFIQGPTNIVDDLCLSLYWQHFVQSQKELELFTNSGTGQCNLKRQRGEEDQPQKRNAVPNIISEDKTSRHIPSGVERGLFKGFRSGEAKHVHPSHSIMLYANLHFSHYLQNNQTRQTDLQNRPEWAFDPKRCAFQRSVNPTHHDLPDRGC